MSKLSPVVYSCIQTQVFWASDSKNYPTDTKANDRASARHKLLIAVFRVLSPQWFSNCNSGIKTGTEESVLFILLQFIPSPTQVVDLNLTLYLSWEYLNPKRSYPCGLSILGSNHNSKELFLLRAEGKTFQVRGGQRHLSPGICLSRKPAGILSRPSMAQNWDLH